MSRHSTPLALLVAAFVFLLPVAAETPPEEPPIEPVPDDLPVEVPTAWELVGGEDGVAWPLAVLKLEHTQQTAPPDELCPKEFTTGQRDPAIDEPDRPPFRSERRVAVKKALADEGAKFIAVDEEANFLPRADRVPFEPQEEGQIYIDTVPLQPLEGSDEAMQAVREVTALAARGERPVRISFWGASHIAGEFLTGYLRRDLQDRYGDSGHGFVMPARQDRWARATDVLLCSTTSWRSDWVAKKTSRRDWLYGMTGVSVSSDDSEQFGWIETMRYDVYGRSVDRFVVDVLLQPGGGTLLLQVDDAAPIEVSTDHERILGGVVELTVPEGPHRLTVKPVGDGEVRIFGAFMERDQPGVIVDPMGVSGKTSASWLYWHPELHASFLRYRNPDMVVLAYGTNEANDRDLTDARYRAELGEVLAGLRRELPDAACVLIGPSDRGVKDSSGRRRVWMPTYALSEIQSEVAQEHGCVYWDLAAAMGGPGSMIEWVKAGYGTSDHIHMTFRGYQETARRFTAALHEEELPPRQP